MPIDLKKELNRVIEADHHDPFVVLGLHDVDKEHSTAVIRAFHPHADSVMLVVGDKRREMDRIREEGVFEIHISDYPETEPFLYQFEASYYGSLTRTFHDPYRFLPQLTEYDQHLFKMGTQYKLYEKMGCHPTKIDNISGTIFRVWAPTARRVSVIGDFNFWDGRVHQMRMIQDSGVWELFIPEIRQGDIYKFEIRTSTSLILEKADPFQFHAELRPKSASIVWD
ncbi:MAG: 1,4-alpha-glucan branching enzyme, partial [Desulfobulbaceae bacterium]|nr:1,4-alpha-glucan branching enzyme [Desulfobulbaceae bacterium]